MKLNYSNSAADFLEHQLFIASQSPTVQKKRRNARWIVAGIYIAIGGVFLITDSRIGALVCSIGGLLWFVFHPLYSRKRYHRHYTRHIAEHYKKRIDRPVDISVDAKFIHLKDATSNAKISTKELEKVIEIPNHYLIKMKTGVSLIVPKPAVAEPEKFTALFRRMNVEVQDCTDWKWQ